MVKSYYLFNSELSEVIEFFGLHEEEQQSIKIYDSQEGMYLLHFSGFFDSDCFNFRGVIYDTKEHRVVCRSSAYIEDTFLNNVNLSEIQGKFTLLYDGTIIRLFYHNGVWRLSTHKRIDASKASWGQENFAQMFLETWKAQNYPDFDQILDQNCCYSFILLHQQNRNVCVIHQNKIILAEKWNYDPETRDFKQDQGPLQVDKILCQEFEPFDLDTFLSYYDNFNNTLDYMGILVDHTNGTKQKILFDKYYQVKTIKGNFPCIEYSILALLVKNRVKEFQTLKFFYPEHASKFDKVKNDLQDLKLFLKSKFIERYFHKKFVYLPQKFHIFISTLHQKVKGTSYCLNHEINMMFSVLTPQHIFEMWGQAGPTPAHTLANQLATLAE
jgi:hypothetical protein